MTATSSRTMGGDFDSAARKPRKPKAKPLPPLSLRLTAEERARLLSDAGNQTLSAYIRSRLFGDNVSPRRKRRKPVADHEALARVLARLGQSRLSSNLNQIARAANTGTLDLGGSTVAELQRACADIAAMRRDLIRALGLSPE